MTPIVKRSRRLGIILGKAKWVQRREYPPGMHGPKQAHRRPRLSSYGIQLLEKQKAKAIYGVMERQLRGYFEKAAVKEGNTAEIFVQLLERRLDNAVFRMGLAKTRRQARQMVGHGFIQVNGKKSTVPSFEVSVGDELTVKESKKGKKLMEELALHMTTAERSKWLSIDPSGFTAKVTSLPEGEDLQQVFDPTLIVEFYSR